MTAEPVKAEHRWPVPPQDGYTVDDLFTLPDLPPHTELIDGSLVFVSPQRRFHAKMISLLENGLLGTVPEEMKVERQMTVLLDSRNGTEPDVSVVRADSVTDLEHIRFQAADVLLAVEVVSADSKVRDQDVKPRKYAAAGIPHFWLVDMAGADRHPIVRVYELDLTTKTYALSGAHHERLKTAVPFTVDLDITLDALNKR